MAADELGGRMDHDIRAVSNRADEVGMGCQKAINPQAADRVCMGNLAIVSCPGYRCLGFQLLQVDSFWYLAVWGGYFFQCCGHPCLW